MFLLIGLFDFNPCIYTEVISQGNFDFPPNACNLREQVQYIPISVSHISCSIEKKLLVSFTHVFKTPQISSYLFFQSSETGKHHIFHTDSKFGFMSQPCNCVSICHIQAALRVSGGMFQKAGMNNMTKQQQGNFDSNR